MKKKNVILEHKKESTLKNLISIKSKLGYKQIGEIKQSQDGIFQALIQKEIKNFS